MGFYHLVVSHCLANIAGRLNKLGARTSSYSGEYVSRAEMSYMLESHKHLIQKSFPSGNSE